MDKAHRLFFLISKGDKRAFKLLFDTFYPRLFIFSLNYIDQRFDAEEIVGEVFVKLWNKRATLIKVEHPKAYMYKMVYNASMAFLKRNRKEIPLNPQLHDTSVLMQELILEEEVHSVLFRALETLPEKCKNVFVLSCIEGLAYKDIAEDLQITINTVKSQRSRAIQLLKTQLKDYSFLISLL